MKTVILPTSVKLWLSANDTYNWAHRPNAAWPCSRLADNRLFVEYDSNGLLDLAINGKSDGDEDLDGTELSACVADHLAGKLPANHPAYSVAVGQFHPQPARAAATPESDGGK